MQFLFGSQIAHFWTVTQIPCILSGPTPSYNLSRGCIVRELSGHFEPCSQKVQTKSNVLVLAYALDAAYQCLQNDADKKQTPSTTSVGWLIQAQRSEPTGNLKPRTEIRGGPITRSLSTLLLWPGFFPIPNPETPLNKRKSCCHRSVPSTLTAWQGSVSSLPAIPFMHAPPFPNSKDPVSVCIYVCCIRSTLTSALQLAS